LKDRLSAALAAIVALGVAFTAQGSPAQAANGAPSGPHYNLNIVGGPGNGSGGASGNVIHVPLTGNCRIDLAEGATYKVLDNSCNDGDAAQFQLPDPDPDNDGVTAYSVYARALGKPGGGSRMTSCLDDAGVTYCSTESVVLIRNKGRSSFSNVSKELLTLCIDTSGDGICDQRVGLFDDAGTDYWWSYDNAGLRLAQLRFYPVPTTVGTTP
jgi:hypothetical protein